MRLRSSILTAFVLAVALVAFAHADPTVARLQGIRLSGPQPVGVDLTVSAPVTATARLIPAAANSPPRIAVDLPKTKLSADLATMGTPNAPVQRVRFAQFEAETVRVVIDLDARAEFAVTQNGQVIRIEIQDPTVHRSPAPSAAASVVPAPITNPPPVPSTPTAGTPPVASPPAAVAPAAKLAPGANASKPASAARPSDSTSVRRSKYELYLDYDLRDFRRPARD